MVVDLLPELVGLFLTPAAIVGCILLLRSEHPYANAASFGAAFVMFYAVICLIVLAIGDTVEPTADTSSAKAVVGITVGGFLLLAAAAIALHHHRTRQGPPKWATMLESAKPTGAFLAGLVLAAANPNLLILLSGLGTVVDSADSRGDLVLGAVLLLGAIALDFVLPVLAFVAFGARAREGLVRLERWMIGHDRQLTIVLLVLFGLLFLGRGIGGL